MSEKFPIPNHEEEAKNANELSRRSFMKRAGNLSLGFSALLTAPFSFISLPPTSAWDIFRDFFIDSRFRKSEEDKNNAKYRVYIRSREKFFTNIGVYHITNLLNYQIKMTSMGRLIAQSDILLLEESSSGRYFDRLKKYGEKSGKKVINIDRSNKISVFVIEAAASVYAGFRAFNQFRIDVVALDSEPEEKWELRKQWLIYVLKTLGVAQLGWVPPSFLISLISTVLSDLKNGTNSYSQKYDISLLGDGRTVFMVVDIMKAIQENPGKKIVVITGDEHAQGIDYYLYHDKDSLKLKEELYSWLYGWVKYLPI